MNIDPKIKNRITKLLALSESPNEAEASAALAKANMLLFRHGLRMEDLSDETPDIKETIINQTDSLKPWEEKLLKCIIEATFTEILKIYEDGSESRKIIGRESNIVTAKILYDYLKKAVETRAVLFQGGIDDMESFRIGMIESIRQKFKERAKQEIRLSNSKELILSVERARKKENMNFIKNNYGSPDVSENWYGVDSNSYGLGKAVGRKISINVQLSSEENDIS